MKKITLAKAFALAQVLGGCSLNKIEASADKFTVVRLMAELQKHIETINTLRSKANALLSEDERMKFLEEETLAEVDIKNTLSESIVQQIVDGSDNIPAGQLAILLWTV